MKPSLNTNISYIEIKEGVLFRGNIRTFILRGAGIYKWIQALNPYLTGDYHIDEITQGMDDSRKNMITNIINELENKGILRDKMKDKTHSLTELELIKYENEIGFIESYKDSGAFRFQLFREKKLAVVGNGLSFIAAIRALLKTGSKNLSYYCTGQSKDEMKLLSTYLKECISFDREISCIEMNPFKNYTLLSSFDIVIYIADRPNANDMNKINFECQQNDTPFIPAIINEEGAVIGPIYQRDSKVCWKCMNDRYQFQTPEWKTSSKTNDIFAVLLGNTVSFHIYQLLTELNDFSKYNIVTLDINTLTQEEYYVETHGHCIHCCKKEYDFKDQTMVKFKNINTPLTETEFNHLVMNHITNPTFGIFKEIDFGDLKQIPVSQCGLIISDHYPHKSIIIENGISQSNAKFNVILKGLETYAQIVTRNKTCNKVFSIDLDRWIDLKEEINLSDFYFTSGLTYDDWISNGKLRITEGKFIEQWQGKVTPEYKLSLDLIQSEEIKYYYKVLQRFLQDFSLISLEYSPTQFIAAIVFENELISLICAPERNASILKAILEVIHKINESKKIDAISSWRRCNLKGKELVVVPWIDDMFLLKKIPIVLGWIGLI